MPGKIFALELMVPGNALGSIFEGMKEKIEDRLHIIVEVPESNLGDILPHVVTHGIRLMSCNPTGMMDPVTRNTGYAHGVRDKGISGKQLVLKLLEGDKRVWRGDEISKEFVKHRFAGGSWGPPMGELLKEQPPRVRSLGRGRYCAAGVVVKPGDLL